MTRNYTDLRNKVPAWRDLLNVRYLIRPASATDPDPVYNDANWKVHERPNVSPPA